MISKESELSKFTEALHSSGFDTQLSSSDFFTVFAPNDNALQNEDLTEVIKLNLSCFGCVTNFSIFLLT